MAGNGVSGAPFIRRTILRLTQDVYFIYFLVCREAPHGPDVVGVEIQIIRRFIYAGRAFDDTDAAVVGCGDGLLVGLVGPHKLAGGQVKCGRDLPYLLGNGGLSDSGSAGTRITIQGYDYYEKLKAPRAYWIKNNWFPVAVLSVSSLVTVVASLIVTLLN